MDVRFLGVNGSIQSAGSGNVSLVVSHLDSHVLVDTSGAVVQALWLAGVDPLTIDTVVLTHAHIDHIYALPSLLHNLWLLKRERPLTILANQKTLEIARNLCSVFAIEQKRLMFPIDWRLAAEGWQLHRLGALSFGLFPVNHGIPTIGCVFSIDSGKLSKIVYLADGMPMETYPVEVMGADLLIHEAGGTVAQEASLTSRGHSTALQAALVAERLSAERMLLCHLCPQESRWDEMLQEARRYFPQVEIPKLFVPYGV
jgi:ribonuclease Z